MIKKKERKRKDRKRKKNKYINLRNLMHANEAAPDHCELSLSVTSCLQHMGEIQIKRAGLTMKGRIVSFDSGERKIAQKMIHSVCSLFYNR